MVKKFVLFGCIAIMAASQITLPQNPSIAITWQEPKNPLYEDREEPKYSDFSPFQLKKSIISRPLHHFSCGLLIAAGLKLSYESIATKSITPFTKAFSQSVPLGRLSKIGKIGYPLTVALSAGPLPLNVANFISNEITYNVISNGTRPHINWTNTTDIYSTLFSRHFWKTPFTLIKTPFNKPLCLAKSVYQRPSIIGWLALGTAASMGLEQAIFSSRIAYKKHSLTKLQQDPTLIQASQKLAEMHPSLKNLTTQSLVKVYGEPGYNLLYPEWQLRKEFLEYQNCHKPTQKETDEIWAAFESFINPPQEIKDALLLLGFNETDKPIPEQITYAFTSKITQNPSEEESLRKAYDLLMKKATNNQVLLNKYLNYIVNFTVTLPGGAKTRNKENVVVQTNSYSHAKEQIEKELPGLISQNAQNLAEELSPFWGSNTSNLEKLNTLRRFLFVIKKETKDHMLQKLQNNTTCPCHRCKKEKICVAPETLDYNTALRILGLQPNSNPSAEEIKKAYKIAAKKRHPDLHKQNPKAKEEFESLVKAYKFLLETLQTNDLEQKANSELEEFDPFQYYKLATNKNSTCQMPPLCLDCWVELCAHYLNEPQKDAFDIFLEERFGANRFTAKNYNQTVSNKDIENNIAKYKSK